MRSVFPCLLPLDLKFLAARAKQATTTTATTRATTMVRMEVVEEGEAVGEGVGEEDMAVSSTDGLMGGLWGCHSPAWSKRGGGWRESE